MKAIVQLNGTAPNGTAVAYGAIPPEAISYDGLNKSFTITNLIGIDEMFSVTPSDDTARIGLRVDLEMNAGTTTELLGGYVYIGGGAGRTDGSPGGNVEIVGGSWIGTGTGGDVHIQGGMGTTNGGIVLASAIDNGITVTDDTVSTQIGFFNTAPVAQPVVTGTTDAQKLASLLTALRSLGLIAP